MSAVLCITGKNSVFLYSGDEDVFVEIFLMFTLHRQRNIRRNNQTYLTDLLLVVW